jgi:hypothetical protein
MLLGYNDTQYAVPFMTIKSGFDKCVCVYTHTHTHIYIYKYTAGIAQSVYRVAREWTVRGSNPGGGEIFRTCLAPPSLLYSGYRDFPGGKAAEAWRLPPTPSSAEVKERVELYLHSTSGSS